MERTGAPEVSETQVREAPADLIALVDVYADALIAAIRRDGVIQFADGLVAKGKKDALRTALQAAIAGRPAQQEGQDCGICGAVGTVYEMRLLHCKDWG